MAKTIFEVYGVEMTSLEEMYFSLWLDKSGIAMNTIYAEERTKLTQDWLTKHRDEQVRLHSK